MKERKYVKLRTNMYEDTKFKIIDMHVERDIIHYIWSRIIILAGKVNLEGDLYLSRNIPYTIETLAIEFNRDAMQVKLALNTLIDLEMIELVRGKIYRVKNFAKHQNIKIKEKVETQHNAEDIKNEEEKSLENQLCEEKNADSEHKICESIEKAQENQVVVDKSINSENIKDDNVKNEVQANIPISMENKKNQKEKKGRPKKVSCIDGFEGEYKQEEDIVGFYEGEYNVPLGKGDKVIMSFRV